MYLHVCHRFFHANTYIQRYVHIHVHVCCRYFLDAKRLFTLVLTCTTGFCVDPIQFGALTPNVHLFGCALSQSTSRGGLNQIQTGYVIIHSKYMEVM